MNKGMSFLQMVMKKERTNLRCALCSSVIIPQQVRKVYRLHRQVHRVDHLQPPAFLLSASWRVFLVAPQQQFPMALPIFLL
jgi:hypothetical protein